MEANQVRNLAEAYSSIYETKMPERSFGPNKGMPTSHPIYELPGKPGGPGGSRGPGESKPTPRPPLGGTKPTLRPEVKRESNDLFDLIGNYLMDEGYADTEEAAIAIMANMSEEWKQSIMNEGVLGDIARGVAKIFVPDAELEQIRKQSRSYDPRAGQRTGTAKPRPGTRDPGRPIDPRSYYNPRGSTNY